MTLVLPKKRRKEITLDRNFHVIANYEGCKLIIVITIRTLTIDDFNHNL